MKIAARLLFIIAVPLLLLASSISLATNCGALYRYGFASNDVSQVTGISESELARASDGLIDYFNSADDYVNITVIKDGVPFVLFNEREAEHLKDVKELFHLSYYIAAAALACCLVATALFLFRWKSPGMLFTAMFHGGSFTILLMAALGIVFLVDFDAFFYQFHLLSFANDLWLLNPKTDYLIMLFPQQFWFHAALFIAAGAAAGAIILGLVGFILKRRRFSEDQ